MLLFFRRFYLLAIALLIINLYPAKAAQKSPDSLYAAGEARFDAGLASVKMPAKFSGHILLQTTINGRGPYYFALDTGASVSTMSPVFAKDVLKLSAKTEKQSKWAYVDAALKFPGLTITNHRFFNIIDYMPEDGVIVAGVLGADFIRHFVLEIDYPHQTVTLYDPKTYKYSDENDLMPRTVSLKMVDNRPHVDVKLLFGDESINADALIDTGSPYHLMWRVGFTKMLPLSKAFSGIVMGPAHIDFGTYNGEYQGNALTKKLDFDVLLGNRVFNDFKVVFDYANSRMIIALPFKKEAVKVCCG